jgi:hypothetical protein
MLPNQAVAADVVLAYARNHAAERRYRWADEAMTMPHEDFDSALVRLTEFVRGLPDNPGWERIVVVEDLALVPDSLVRVMAKDVLDSGAYAERFAELAVAGYAWLNLHAAGLLAGSILLVTVERPPGGSTGVVRTSINISGPPNFVRARQRWSVDDLLVQEGIP